MSVPSLHRESTDSLIPGKDIMVDPTLMSGYRYNACRSTLFIEHEQVIYFQGKQNAKLR